MLSEKYPWLKNKGYLHLIPQIDIVRRQREIVEKITDPQFVQSHAFFPLIHTVIKERKYKKIEQPNIRKHSSKDKTGEMKSNAKERPLHYASHLDALIFGYYAQIIQQRYEAHIASIPELSKCVIAYRKIPTGIDTKNKGTVHFAKEVFNEIALRSKNDCSVLMFDIKSFFSRINHEILENAWKKILEEDVLPKDHKNVFNATTRFSYILLDDLRREKNKRGRKSGYDEKTIASIRKKGKHCFFETPKEFREKVKRKEITIYRYPFTDKKTPVGIPQGLPLSATLANLYLLEFDKKIYQKIVLENNGFYRRYSDDILIICNPEHVDIIKEYVKTTIEESKVEISIPKTEEYIFKIESIGKKEKITSIKIINDVRKIGHPLTYLGFEFYGEKILIKSANLAKFYRRMKQSIKSKASRANKQVENNPSSHYVIYRRQLQRLYNILNLNKTTIRTRINKLVRNEKNEFELKVIKLKKPMKSNYLSYVERASRIMEDESITYQLRNHKRIFNETIYKHKSKYKD